MKRNKKISLKVILAFILIFALVIIFNIDSENIEVINYKINSDKISDEIKIVQLSDLHSKTFKDENSLINYVHDINPDVIVMTGDMSNNTDLQWDEFIKLCKNLKDYKMIYINGNHEQALEMIYKKYYDNNIKQMEDLGVIVLRDESLEIKINDSTVVFNGLEIPLDRETGMYMESKYIKLSYIENMLGDIEEEKFNILLSHTPEFFNYYASWGADLTLAGHIHGGIIRLPFLGGLLSPNKMLFPKYDSGEYKKGDSTMIVNRGLGTSSIKFRFNNRPEISVITLNPSDN